MSSSPRALVIGGSVGGLLAAGCLRRAGWDTAIFERSAGTLAGRGAGLGVTAELLEIMASIGARFEPSAATSHGSYAWMDRNGDIVFEYDRKAAASAWPRVYDPLRAAIPDEICHHGKVLTRVEQDAGSVTAIFADGSRETGDLLVAADGVRSTVRAQYLPGVEPVFANYVAWRGLVAEQDVPPESVAALGERLLMCFPDGELLLTMTVPGEGEDMRPGHRRIYFIWYHPADADRLRDLHTDAEGRYHGAAIPPPLIRPEFISHVRKHAGEVLPASVAAIVRAAPQLLLQAISDLETPQMVFGRVAMMGDAAFVARPHSAAGVSKAALDAKCLADELAASPDDLPEALTRFEARRLDFGRKLVAHARYLGAYLEGYVKPPELRRPEERTRDPRRIIMDYGAPHLLHDADVGSLAAMSD